MFSAISRRKFNFVKFCLDEKLVFLMKWCVGKVVYNSNPASDAENTK